VDESGSTSPAGAALFAGTASYYSRYRLPYPDALFEKIAGAFGLGRASRVLDLGTGTGQVAIPLAGRCAEVIALDISPEMIAEARRTAESAGVTNVRWLVQPAEAISAALGQFELVTIGQAFHWMDRDEVLRRVAAALTPEGGIALLGGTTIWGAPEPWAEAVVTVVRRWLGEERRAGGVLHAGTAASNHRRFEDVLADGGFDRQETGTFHAEHAWDLDGLIGNLYSTSYCSPALLGENRAAFEADLRRTLLALQPDEQFVQAIRFDYFFAWRS
jgi:SAM-dependent methyltransferase